MSELERHDSEYLGHSTQEDETISLLDLLEVIAKRKWVIVAFTGFVAVITIAFLVSTVVLPATSRWNYLPNKYRAAARILLQDSTPGATNAAFTEFVTLLLTGDATADAAAAELGLAEKYHLTKEGARQLVKKGLRINSNAVSGILQVSYEYTDPTLAAAVANSVTSRLQSEFKRLTLDKLSFKSQYVEKAIAHVESDISDQSAELQQFRDKYGISDDGASSRRLPAALAVQYSDMQRGLRVQEALLIALRQQSELRKIDTITSRTLQVVDNAEAPEVRSGPNRSKIALVSTITALFVSILLAFIIEYIERARNNPVEAGKLRAIRSSIGLRNRFHRE